MGQRRVLNVCPSHAFERDKKRCLNQQSSKMFCQKQHLKNVDSSSFATVWVLFSLDLIASKTNMGTGEVFCFSRRKREAIGLFF